MPFIFLNVQSDGSFFKHEMKTLDKYLLKKQKYWIHLIKHLKNKRHLQKYFRKKK